MESNHKPRSTTKPLKRATGSAKHTKLAGIQLFMGRKSKKRTNTRNFSAEGKGDIRAPFVAVGFCQVLLPGLGKQDQPQGAQKELEIPFFT